MWKVELLVTFRTREEKESQVVYSLIVSSPVGAQGHSQIVNYCSFPGRIQGACRSSTSPKLSMGSWCSLFYSFSVIQALPLPHSPTPSGWWKPGCSWKPGKADEPCRTTPCHIRTGLGMGLAHQNINLQGTLGKSHPAVFRTVFWSVEQYAILALPPHFCLHRVKGELGSNALQCAMHVYRTEGLHGFYRGITASYAGVSETIIHFVIYEALKQHLRNGHHSLSTPFTLSANSRDFFGLMGAAAVSKTCASCIAYPHGEWVCSPSFCSPWQKMPCLWDHSANIASLLVSPEVIRTRLREEGSRYRSFIQTLQLIVREEGPLALYRGLLAHLIRQIPNTAIMMATYELIVRLAPPTL